MCGRMNANVRPIVATETPIIAHRFHPFRFFFCAASSSTRTSSSSGCCERPASISDAESDTLGRHRRGFRRRRLVGHRGGVLALILGEQRPLLLSPWESDEDERGAEQDGDDAGGVRPLVAAEEGGLRSRDDLVLYRGRV